MCGVAGLICPNINKPVRATQVLLTTATGVNTYSLPDLAQFKNGSKVVGFSHRLPASGRKTILGNNVVSAGVMKVSTLNLKGANGTDLIAQLPMENLQNDITGYRDVYWIFPQEFDMANSNVTVSDVSTITANEQFELIVYTIDPNC